MDAMGWESAHFWGISEGAMMGQLFAAEYPERVRTLTLVNAFVSPRYIPRVAHHFRIGEDPWALDRDGIHQRFLEITKTWGVDASPQVEWEVPSKAGDASFVRWMARGTELAYLPGVHPRLPAQTAPEPAVPAEPPAPQRSATRVTTPGKWDRIAAVALCALAGLAGCVAVLTFLVLNG